MIRIIDYKFKDISWRPKVLVTSKEVSEVGLKLLREKCDVTVCETTDRAEMLKKANGMDGILWGTHTALNAEVLDAAGPNLKALSAVSVGVDYIDVLEIKRRNITLGNTPTVLNDAVADVAIGLALAASRRFHEGRLNIESSEWMKRSLWTSLRGVDIRGSTIGIVGFGGVGQTVAKRLQSFDIGQILYCGHTKKSAADKFDAKFVEFEELIRESDFVFIICPLTSETKHMFNADVFSKMKTSSVLINVARGMIVEQTALVNALKTNQIFAAGLDVFYPEPLPNDHVLLTLHNCVITPHIASSSYRTIDDMATVAALNILAGLAGEPLYSAVC